MPKYVFEIEAADGSFTQWDADLPDREAARMHAIDLAEDRLELEGRGSRAPEIRIAIKDGAGDLLDAVYSIAV